MIKKLLPHAIAIAIGITIWFLVEPYGPNQEHWDNPIYWKFVYPAICIACILLGFVFSNKSWIYGLLIIVAQALPAMIKNLDAELIGVSFILLLIISIPPGLSGLIGSYIRSRYNSRNSYTE